jgi:hypothetical protein
MGRAGWLHRVAAGLAGIALALVVAAVLVERRDLGQPTSFACASPSLSARHLLFTFRA